MPRDTKDMRGIDFDAFRKEGRVLSSQVREKAVGYIAAAFGLVAGLAWNDAITSLIEAFFPAAQDTVLAKFIYAVVITIVVVAVTIYLLRLFRKKEKEEEEGARK